MSLEQAILGFLSYRPFSGYDLKKIFDTSVQHFWPADQSQIYRTLNRLTENGWATMERVEQENRPDRKVYHITAVGRDALRDWLVGPVPVGDHRSAALIQVFFAGQLPDEDVLGMFERAAASVREGLKQYDEIPENMEAYSEYVESRREFYFWMLTLEAGKTMARANLGWMESVIQRIREGRIPKV
jgi:DNA-binding PadR family transcriptional regulator